MTRFLRLSFAACLLSFLLSILTIPSAAKYPSISGECGCAYIPALDKMVYDKNATRRHPMASTTKIMTALVALERTRPSDEVVVSPKAVGIEGSSIYLKAGEHQTMENLLYALLLESANDAAAAIAIHTAGSIEAFADMMNTHAAELELADTHFTNPHGLSDEQHYTTALDLARIAAAAMENETFYKIVSTKQKTITSSDGTISRSLSNHNRLLRSYADCVGVKTGFTKKSGRCLVSAAERNGMLLIAVTLDAPDDWHDHVAMLDYGFSQYEGRVLSDCLDLSFTMPVVGGTSSEITVSARSAPAVVVEQGSPALTMSVELNRFAVAPVRRGDVLGLVRYTQNEKTVATVPLLADHSIEKIQTNETLWDKIKNIWNK
ncbi:MAG: D-alanyl-D-alanine carboxypeptidase [Clostridia bacterium]|nr:D-alanyl-D-alanine carboxypeptidase [Clostridia bacterium]